MTSEKTWQRKGNGARSVPYQPTHNYSLQRFDARFNGGNQPNSEIDFFIPLVAKE